MKKLVVALTCAGLLFSQGIYVAPAFAAETPAVMKIAPVNTGLLIIAPVEFKTQDFLKIAKDTFGKGYSISQDTQDAWATYCWNKGIDEIDLLTKKEILADFVKATDFDRVIFLILKDAVVSTEEDGASYNASPLFGGIFGGIKRKARRRSSIETRVVVMNHEGETLKVFEESYTDASMTSELRANRGAFSGLCKNISARLTNSK